MKKTKKYLLEEEEILSSQAFKRLKSKTQACAYSDKHVHVTERLTHSLDVGITARLILSHLNKQIKLPVNYIQLNNICLLHDIGHPPFGHMFEKELQEVLKKDDIHFEGNANNLKIIEKENLNISKKTIVSLIKYPYKIDNNRKKGLYASQYKTYIKELIKQVEKQYKEFEVSSKKGEEFLKERRKYKKLSRKNCDKIIKKTKIRLIETMIMEEADDISYLTQDLKDYIKYIKKHQNIIIEIPEKYKDNKYINILKGADKRNIEDRIKEIKKILIDNLIFDREEYKIKYKDKEVKEIKYFLRSFTQDTMILEANEKTSHLIDLKRYFIYMFSNIENEEFINKNIQSESYKKAIIKEKTLIKKKKLMINFIAEKTDDWLLEDYLLHKNKM